jgi:hypothetical protein
MAKTNLYFWNFGVVSRLQIVGVFRPHEAKNPLHEKTNPGRQASHNSRMRGLWSQSTSGFKNGSVYPLRREGVMTAQRVYLSHWTANTRQHDRRIGSYWAKRVLSKRNPFRVSARAKVREVSRLRWEMHRLGRGVGWRREKPTNESTLPYTV